MIGKTQKVLTASLMGALFAVYEPLVLHLRQQKLLISFPSNRLAHEICLLHDYFTSGCFKPASTDFGWLSLRARRWPKEMPGLPQLRKLTSARAKAKRV